MKLTKQLKLVSKPCVLTFKRQSGMTVVELMVAVSVGLLLMLAVAKVFEQARLTGRGIESTQVVQEGAAFALDRMAYSIRMAKNAGCIRGRNNSLSIKAAAQAPTDVVNLFTAEIGPEPASNDTAGVHTIAAGLLKSSAFIKGFQGGAGFALSGASSLNLANAGTLTNGLTAAPDVLRVAGAKADFTHLSAAMTNSDDGTINTMERIFTGASGTKLLLISDCDSGELFYAAPSGGANSTTMTYDGTSNASASLRRAYKLQSTISEMDVKQYFIAGSTNATQFARDGWTLYEQSLGSPTGGAGGYQIMGTPQPLLSQITRFNIEYGINSLNTNPNVMDAYKTADQITDWSQVNMVRITLGVQGAVTGTETSASQQYVGRAQQVYSIQAEIRN